MILSEVARNALALPEDERIELARRLVESVSAGSETNALLGEGIQRIEDVASGKVIPLDEEQFRAALG